MHSHTLSPRHAGRLRAHPGEILERIAASSPLDGIFLELHGAMVAEHVDDGEGELLARLRHSIGRDLPIAISLDLHANVTPAMVEHADIIDMYRYYPHIDMVETGVRAGEKLVQIIRSGRRPPRLSGNSTFSFPSMADAPISGRHVSSIWS